jgi:hypothetical protein
MPTTFALPHQPVLADWIDQLVPYTNYEKPPPHEKPFWRTVMKKRQWTWRHVRYHRPCDRAGYPR